MTREQLIESGISLTDYEGYCPLNLRSKEAFAIIPKGFKEADWEQGYKSMTFLLWPKIEVSHENFVQFGNGRIDFWEMVDLDGLNLNSDFAFDLNELLSKRLSEIGAEVVKNEQITPLSVRNNKSFLDKIRKDKRKRKDIEISHNALARILGFKNRHKLFREAKKMGVDVKTIEGKLEFYRLYVNRSLNEGLHD